MYGARECALIVLAATVASGAAADSDPRKDCRDLIVVKAFTKALASKSAVKQSCAEISGPEGNTAPDRVLKSSQARQKQLAAGRARYPTLDRSYTARAKGRAGRAIMMNPPADRSATTFESAGSSSATRTNASPAIAGSSSICSLPAHNWGPMRRISQTRDNSPMDEGTIADFVSTHDTARSEIPPVRRPRRR